MKRRTMFLPLALAAATLALPVPAGATSASHTDPRGDVSGAGDPRSDIIGVDITNTGGTVTVGMSLANPEVPTSRNWVEGDTGIFWTLFVGETEYEVNFSSFDDGLYGSMFDEAEKEMCKGQVKAAYGADKRYTASFPSSCLGDPPELSVTSEMGYDDIASGRGPSEDVAPDDSEDCCTVTP